MIRNHVCAIVVAYHPGPELPELVKMLSPQVGAVVVVANSPLDVAKLKQAVVLQNTTNLGTAAAYNAGMKWAEVKGFQAVLIFDQDSLVGEHFVRDILAAYDESSDREKIAAMGPTHEAFGESQTLRRRPLTLLASGSLIPLAVFRTVGPFREDFFVDHVDHEFCLRARKRGFLVVQTGKATMGHQIGRPISVRIWRWSVHPMNAAPPRLYYGVRNYFFLLREYFPDHLRWFFDQGRGLVKQSVKMMLFESEKIPKAMAIAKGLYDGILTRSGR